MKTYPITKSVLEEWQSCETGSWEDHNRPVEGHIFCVLTRAKTRLKVDTNEEAAWLVHSAYYQGDTVGLDPGLVRTRAAIGRIGERIADDFNIPFTKGLWYRERQ